MVRELLWVSLFLFNNLVPFQGLSQSPSQLPLPRQRLLLQLSYSYFSVVKEFQVDLDSSLLYTSHSLGSSRLPVIAEGFESGDLAAIGGWIDARDPSTALRMLPSLSGIPHLRLLVLLGAYYAFQPDAYHTSKDSAVLFLSQARDESQALHEPAWGRQALCLLGKVFLSGNALEQGNAFFRQLTDECAAAGDLAGEARAWMYRGLYTVYSPGTTDDRIAYLEKARALYRRQKNPEGEINALMDIGYLWVSSLQMVKGEDAFRQALHLEDSIGFPYTHYTTDAIAMATFYEGRYGEPLKYSLQCVRTAEATKDSIGWAYFYNRVGTLIGFQESRRAECLRWLERSLDRFIRAGGDPSLYRDLTTLTFIMIDDGRSAEALAQALHIAKLYPPTGPVDQLYYYLMMGDCYTELKKYDLAEKNYFKVAMLEKKAESMRGTFSRAYINARIGSFYFKTGRYPIAKEYCRQFLSDPSHLNVPIIIAMEVQKMLFVIDSASGQSTPAIRHLQQYLHFLDSNFNISERRQAEDLSMQYETEKKENEIRIRDQHIHSLIQADLLKQASLKRAALLRNITIAAIGVLLIIGGLLYRQYRQKQRVNRVMERLLAEKEWLLKEVHHRVKNNLHTVISLLESQAEHLENDALEAIESSQHRIYAMSLIHQKIYQSDDIKTIDMANYLPEFIRYLMDSFGRPANIRIRLDLAAIRFGVSQAIPVALIINEAVTNAIKYAFPEGRPGEIVIGLHAVGEQIELSVADNGIGMDPALLHAELNTLGIELIKGLSMEIEGRIAIETDKGTRITVLFDAEAVA